MIDGPEIDRTIAPAAPIGKKPLLRPVDRLFPSRVEQETQGIKAIAPSRAVSCRRIAPRDASLPTGDGDVPKHLKKFARMLMRRFIKFLAASLLAALCVQTAIAQPPEGRRPFATPDTPRQTGRIRQADIKHIKAVLTFDLHKKEVHGTVTHTLTPLHPFLSTLDLDIGPKLKVSKVTAGPQNAECKFTVKGEKLTITFDKPYGPNDTIDLAITYAGAPGSGLHFVAADPAYPERPQAVWTQGEAEDNHHWLPCYDYPNDRVTTEMIITVAKPFSVVSNGALVSTKENSDGTRLSTGRWTSPTRLT